MYEIKKNAMQDHNKGRIGKYDTKDISRLINACRGGK